MKDEIGYADFVDIVPTEKDVDTEIINSGLARIAVCLCVDTSGSMSSSGRIKKVNEGLLRFLEETKNDTRAFKSTDLAIVTFDSSVKVVTDFTPLTGISIPLLYANGSTEMGKGVLKSIEILEKRKNFYKANGIDYYRPMLFVFSDGGDNGSRIDFQDAVLKVKEYSNSRKVIAFGIAVDRDSNKEELTRITNRPAAELNACKFIEFFEWLSKSVCNVSRSSTTDTTVALPPTNTWAGWDTV